MLDSPSQVPRYRDGQVSLAVLPDKDTPGMRKHVAEAMQTMWRHLPTPESFANSYGPRVRAGMPVRPAVRQ